MKINDIDKFIDESLIPKNIVYRKINNSYNYEVEYEEIIPLSVIVRLNKSAEEKEYITKRLKEKGIKVIGFSDNVDFESEDYIFTRKYQGTIPKSISEEETKKKLEQYSKTKDKETRNEIVLGNMRLVNFAMINLNNNYHAYMYDLQQAGYIGLIQAVENYDPSKGAFSTFALSYINGKIRLELYELNGYKNSEYAFYTTTKEIEKEYGEKVLNNSQLAGIIADRIIKSNFRKEHKEENIRRVLINNPVSLDEILEQDEEEKIYKLGYEIEDSDINSCYDDELRRIINEKIKILKEKQQELLTMRYGLNNTKAHTLREIAEKYDITTTGVDFNIKTALNKLSNEDEEIQGLRYYLHREI